MLLQFRHQAVVVDGVEELREIHFHHELVALGDVPLGLRDGLMRTLARPESVTEFRESRVEVLGQHLRDSLLDHAILSRRNAQHTCTSVGLRNVYALDRGGNADPFTDVREDARSVFGKVSG